MPFAGAAESTNLVNNSSENINQNTISNNAITDQILNKLSSEEITKLQDWLKEKNFNTNITNLNLTVGANSEDVKTLQKWLKEHNFYVGEIDGQFGNYTQEAVKLFQKTSGITEDGWVGIETLQSMQSFEEMYEQENSSKNSKNNTSTSSTSSKSSKASYSTSKTKTTIKYTTGYTRSYSGGKGTGDCWVNSAILYSQLTGSGVKARIIQYGTSLSPRHRSVQIYQNGAWVDYNYKTNGYAKLYYATKNKPGMTVIK